MPLSSKRLIGWAFWWSSTLSLAVLYTALGYQAKELKFDEAQEKRASFTHLLQFHMGKQAQNAAHRDEVSRLDHFYNELAPRVDVREFGAWPNCDISMRFLLVLSVPRHSLDQKKRPQGFCTRYLTSCQVSCCPTTLPCGTTSQAGGGTMPG